MASISRFAPGGVGDREPRGDLGLSFLPTRYRAS